MLSTSLSQEIKIWTNCDKFYKNTVKTMHEMPQVYRICVRENLLVVLRKFTTEIESCREGLNRFLETKR